MLKHESHCGRSQLAPLLLVFIASAFAQTPGNVSTPPPTPQQTSKAVNLPLNPALPTVFIIGDSTARNQADLGWGDHVAHLIDTNRINVANRAIAGRSSHTYIEEGHWSDVLAEMKPGDYVLLPRVRG